VKDKTGLIKRMISIPNKPLGLLAGSGRLPVYLAQFAKKRGYYLVVVGPEQRLEPGIKPYADKIFSYKFARLGEVLRIFEREGIEQAVMAGKIEKRWLYQEGLELDELGEKLLKKAPNRKDDSLMNLVVEELEKRGIKIISILDLSEEWLAPVGSFSASQPEEREWKDIEFGFEMAKEIGRLDIGQTVCVHNQAVLSVEAIEGTDLAILRAGEFSPGAVVVKVWKPNQNLKFDIPVVGRSTVEAMIQAKARVLAVEAGRCLVVEKDEMMGLADQKGIALVGVKDGKR